LPQKLSSNGCINIIALIPKAFGGRPVVLEVNLQEGVGRVVLLGVQTTLWSWDRAGSPKV